MVCFGLVCCLLWFGALCCCVLIGWCLGVACRFQGWDFGLFAGCDRFGLLDCGGLLIGLCFTCLFLCGFMACLLMLFCRWVLVVLGIRLVWVIWFCLVWDCGFRVYVWCNWLLLLIMVCDAAGCCNCCFCLGCCDSVVVLGGCWVMDLRADCPAVDSALFAVLVLGCLLIVLILVVLCGIVFVCFVGGL